MVAAAADHGLRIVFDPALDRSAWPGPVPGVGAAFGEAWLGSRGLLGRLEGELCLGGIVPSRGERAARLLRRLHDTAGFWSRSLEADPLGTADRLLADRDELRMWGWRGEPVSTRLAALAEVTDGALPGIADRLEAVIAELGKLPTSIQRIEVAMREELLEPRWRELLDALRAAGVEIAPRPLEPAVAAGDLAAARTRSFTPAGDGSLVLFRPHGPLAAAEELAGALAARDAVDDILLVGPDRVVADAFERAGLPRPPGPGSVPASMAALRLVVELIFRPADPALLYKLLCLEPGPVPRSIGRRLARVLSNYPGRGTQAWRDAIDEGVAAADEERRERLRARLEGLLEPVVERDQPVPVEEVISRTRLLSGWARGVAERTPSVGGVVMAAELFIRLLQELPKPTIDRVDLRRLLDETDDVASFGVEAEAGLAAVDRPGAVLGPASIVIWWGFTRDSARAARPLRLTAAEGAGLRERGLEPPSSSVMARAAAQGWRRPLEQASQSLVLVCPRTVEAGEKGFPHPLWDEIAAAAGGHADGALVSSELTVPASPRRTAVSLRPLPVAQESWNVGRAVALRDGGESPSSLESLLGCSLRWGLHYHGFVRQRWSAPPEPGPRLYGSLAHELLAELFADGAPEPADARVRAEALLDSRLPAMCETLYLPRHQVELSTLRRAVIESAAELARIIGALGAVVRNTEERVSRDLPELSLYGIPDLVLDRPETVIDLKWSKSTNQKKLASGTALQLAAYAELVRSGPGRAQIAYFILNHQLLLGESGTSLPDAQAVGDHQALDIWRAAMASLDAVKNELGEGALASPGAVAEIEGSLDDGKLTIAPGCRYCGYGGMCGGSPAK